MFNRRSPLLNAASSAPVPPADGGGAPAPVNAAAPAVTAAPAPVVAPAPVNAAPAPAPVNAAPAPAAAPDFAALITGAVNAAVAPLNQRLADMENRLTHGVVPANLGGAPAPVANAQPPSPGQPEKKQPINYAEANPLALISEGCREAFKAKGINLSQE